MDTKNISGDQRAAADEIKVPELISRYASDIAGQLRCWDRVVITGTLVEVCHAKALKGKLDEKGIRCFDIGQYAEPLREQVRKHAAELASCAGVEIQHLDRKSIRKEDLVAQKLRQRQSSEAGLICVFSAMENCTAFKPWHDKSTGTTGLRATQGKCLHYYFYFLHARYGLIYVRVPTWLPFRLQIYFNGHNWLARKLDRAGLSYRMEDNAIVELADWQRAQELADQFQVDDLLRDLNTLARLCVPVLAEYPKGYYWSLMQLEYSWDVVWKDPAKLAPVYAEISRQAILRVKAPDVAKFLGKRMPAGTDTALGSDFHTRVEGTRVKHHLGPASIKLYDKRGRVLRVECTANDVRFFKHHRKVEHSDGSVSYRTEPLRKGVHSLSDLRGLMAAATRRYLDFLSQLEDRTRGKIDLHRLTRDARDQRDRNWRGFNLFASADLEALTTVLRAEHTISGFTNRRIRSLLANKTPGQVARVLKRMRLHGLIKKIRSTYKYYITALGQRLIIAALKIKEHILIPSLASA